MSRPDRFIPPLFRLYQSQATSEHTAEELKVRERRGKWFHHAYDFFVAYVYSLAVTAISLTLAVLPMQWPLQLIVQAAVFAVIAVARRFLKWVAVGAAVLLAAALVYLYVTKGFEPLWRNTLEPLSYYFYDMGSYMSGYEVPNPEPARYAILLGAGIAALAAVFAYLSYHPWVMLIAAGTLYGVSLKAPSVYQTVFFLIAVFAVFLTLAKKRDFATVQQNAMVRRAKIPSNRYVRTALPIVLLLMAAVLLFNWLLPADVFYSKTLDDMMSRLTGYSFNEDKSIGYYEFSLRTAGYYPLDTRLGGPVTPSDEPYLEITSGQHSVYLRGAVYATYDGQLWRQDSMDPNWLFNHARNKDVQRDVLGLPLGASIPGDTELLGATPRQPLAIVPIKEQQVVFNGGRLDNLDYLSSVDDMFAYFNASGTMYSDKVIPESGYLADGEIFRVDQLHRPEVLYALSAGFAGNAVPRINRDGDATRWLQVPEIPQLQNAVAAHDETLFNLVYGEPSGTTSDRVLAIRSRLAETLTYKLDVPAPDPGAEFVSWFLETKEGYCTYFGTALTVLLREAGIPARYVEGFLVPAVPGGGPRILTGEQAHAWTEVWFEGMGWIPIDATPQSELDNMNQEEAIAEEPPPPPEEPTPEPTPEITPEPEPPEEEPPEPEPNLGQKLLNLLLAIFKWLLLLSPLIAFLVWRYFVWRKRHDIAYLVKRFAGREHTLVTAVWQDLKEIWALQGIRAMEDETVRQFFGRLLEHKPLALDPGLSTYESVEKALYSEHEFENKEIVDLLVLYRREEQKAKQRLPWYTWLFRRFLWSPKHPL